MIRPLLIAGAALTLAACGGQGEADRAATPEPGAVTPAQDQAPAEAAGPVTGAGTVTAKDAAAGTVTIDHEPIPELGWPAMDMAFPVEGEGVLDQVEVGDRVTFQMTRQGNRITSMQRE